MSNMIDPMVSIVIPVYNGSNYLKNAIDCALAQDYKNLEVIVVNDGSCDDGETERVALSFGDRIRYFSKENGGVSSALNCGIRMMRGAYFSWLSHDDAYSTRKISDAVALLRSNDMIGKKCVAFTGGCFIDKKNEEIKAFEDYFPRNTICDGVQAVTVMTRKGTLNGCCMLIPKRIFEEVGMFDEELRYSQDALMWYKMFLNGYSLISDNHKNVMYRLHHGQASQTRRDLYEHDAVIIAKELASPLLEADKTGRLLYRYTKRLTRQSCGEAIACLKQFAADRNAFSAWMRFKLALFTVIGKMRYRLVRLCKKILIR